MNAVALLRRVYAWGPLLFGIGFVAPLVAQTLDTLSTSAPLGLSNIQLGLAIGISSGMIAKLRGSWI